MRLPPRSEPRTLARIVPPVKLPADGHGSLAFWIKEADRSKQWWETLASTRNWEKNLQSYLGKGLEGTPTSDTIAVPKDFANVEQKKALLFFQVPDVTLTAKQPALEPAIPVFQAVLNHTLSPHGIHAGALMDEVLFDVLCPAGIGVSKIGYDVETDGEVDVPTPMIDPAGVPIVDPMTQQPVMGTQKAPNIVRERYFWDRVPLKQFLMPVDFHGSDFDKAPWLGFRFEMDVTQAARQFRVPKETLRPTKADDATRLKSDLPTETSGATKVCGYEIWYQASLYHEDVANGDLFYQLVWLDGMDEPVTFRPSPYQRVDNGRLVGGMRGNPIHVLTLRYVSDLAVPPSDVSMSRALVDEISDGRSQMVRQRKRTTPIMGYDPARIPQATVARITSDPTTQEWMPIPNYGLDGVAAGEIRAANFPRENFSFNDIINADIQEVWAMGANQQGLQSQRKQSATEASIQQSATQTRMKREQVQVSRWFIDGVEKLGALIQLFADEQDYVEVVGPDGAKTLTAWNKDTIQGRFAYSAKPDSSLQLDAAFDKKQALDEYSFFRKDPLVNPTTLLTRTARKLGIDPGQFIVPPAPPPPPPKPTPSFAFKGEDFNPMMPQFSIVLEILKQAGFAIPPEVVAQSQNAAMVAVDAQQQVEAQEQAQAMTEHGGLAPKAESMSKHQSSQTGMLPGGGLAGSVQ